MNICRLINTLTHLRFKQIVYQAFYRLYKPRLKTINASNINLSIHLTTYPISRASCLDIHNTVFEFIGICDKFHSWNDTSHGMLWAYNLNYMDWLQQDDISLEEGSMWIDRFIENLPENHIGLDPYPIALRGINWIKFIIKYRGNLEDRHLQRWNNCLYSQYVLLTKKLEYHLLGNHLLEDACSLFIAAFYFKNKSFYKTATGLLRSELKEQILPDGAHYEQSPMYHCILLDRVLDCYNFALHNIYFEKQETIIDFLHNKAVLMLGHLESIVYKDETIPLLNDSAYNIAHKAQVLKKYAIRLGLVWQKIPMKQCGYRKMENDEMEIIADIGNITASYQPGHTHADTFNYELRINGQPIVVDTGISTYNKTERRQYERSTVAHNTVSINQKDSSEVWSGFRVGKRANVTILSDQKNEILAYHNGFGKKIIHTRTFRLEKCSLHIIDEISDYSPAWSYIHLSPDVEILSTTPTEIKTNKCTITLEKALEVTILDDYVSNQYNVQTPIKIIKIQFEKYLHYKIAKQ